MFERMFDLETTVHRPSDTWSRPNLATLGRVTSTTDSVHEHPNVRRVTQALRSAGVETDVVVLAASAPTAAAAAGQLGCPVGAIANSLVFDADGGPVLVLTSGAHRADTSVIAAAAGAASVTKATAAFVRTHTGQPIGGVAPLGHPQPIPTLVDTWLGEHDTVWAAAGHPHTVFATSFEELLRLTGGTPVDVGA